MDHERLAAKRLFELVKDARRLHLSVVEADVDDVEAMLAFTKSAALEIPSLRGRLNVAEEGNRAMAKLRPSTKFLLVAAFAAGALTEFLVWRWMS
jgi:hypothetical protein